MALTNEIELSASTPPDAVPVPLDVTIVVVTWNSAPWIARCLSSLADACGSLSWEVIVHDNASCDESADVAARSIDRERGEVVRSSRNDGFAGGVNRCVARSRGRFVFLLNPDCELQSGCVETLVGRLDASGAAGAVPLLLGEDGVAQREFQLRRFPTLRTFAAELFMTERLFGRDREIDRYRCRDLDPGIEQPVEQPAGAALLLRRELIASIGPFDEGFAPAWFEDVDYCRRIAEAGGEILLVPGARATHHGGASLARMEQGEFVEIWYRNLWRYAGKWFTRDDRERLRWCIIAGVGMRWLAVAVGLGENGGEGLLMAGYSRVIRSAWTRWQSDSRSS